MKSYHYSFVSGIKKISNYSLFFLSTVILMHCHSGEPDLPDHLPAQVLNNTVNTTPPAQDTIHVAASEIGQSYNSNEIKADQQFKLKLVQVKGIIRTIGRGLSNNAFVVIKGTDRFTDIFCYLTDNKEAEDLLPGKPVTIVGKCQGLWANIILNDCSIQH